jgi:hypothetical protein
LWPGEAGSFPSLGFLVSTQQGDAGDEKEPPSRNVRARFGDCFSASGDDLRLRRQVEMLDTAADDMMDRFVLFTPIVPDGKRVSTPADSPYTVLSSKEMAAVRAQFHISAGEFTVLLLDEDGTVKLRSPSPVNADRLNALIDKLPGRQAEMQRPHAN